MPKVSIIIPLYKTEQYMQKCVDSLLNQELDDIEVILVDDGSPDRCGEIADIYADDDVRVKTVHKENDGLSSARNAGLALATGEYIGFVDSDDWVEKGMFANLFHFAAQNDADMAVCNYCRVYPGRIEEDCLKIADEIVDVEIIGLESYICKYLLPYVHGHEVCNKIYRKSIIQSNLLRFESNQKVFSEDLLFNLKALCHIKKIGSIKSTGYNYLQRGDSIMGSIRPNLTMREVALVGIFIDYAKESGKYQELQYMMPLLLHQLLNTSLFVLLREGHNRVTLEWDLRRSSSVPIMRESMFHLAFGRALTVYCSYHLEKPVLCLQTQIKGRFFGMLYYLGLFRLLAYLKYKKYHNTKRFIS